MNGDDKVIKEVNNYYKKKAEETKHLTEEESLELSFKEAQKDMKRKKDDDDKKAAIWNYDDKGKRKSLDHKTIAHILIEEYFFITVGVKVREIWYYQNGIYKSEEANLSLNILCKLTPLVLS